MCCVQRKMPEMSRCPLRTTWEHLRACALRGNQSWLAVSSAAVGLGVGGWGGSSQRWRQGRQSWSRCAARGDLRGPTAWTSRGYFWRGFVRLDSSSKSREEGRGITDTLFALREPSVIPAATFGWRWHVYLLGKRQVTELWLKHTGNEGFCLVSGQSRVCF